MRLKEQEDVVEGLRREVEKECMVSDELRNMVKSLEGAFATMKNMGLVAARK